MKPPFKFDARSNEIDYRAKAIVGAFAYALLGLAIPLALLAFSCAFIWFWVDVLHLPG